MVALGVVLEDELPVGVDVVGDAVRRDQLRQGSLPVGPVEHDPCQGLPGVGLVADADMEGVL